MSGTGGMGRDRLAQGVLAGRYRLLRPLGRGGMAEVHFAHDEVLGRDVAVKILLAKFLTDTSFLERFRREARAAAALSHPNIVAVHDTGVEDDVPFIVMEYVSGRSLEALLSDGGVGRDRALEICAEVCSALGYAHDHGIVHLDIKPGNILIAADGRVKVTDFGIARATGSDTVTASVLGTASYLSPEQARSDPVDGRSDLYSLGVVLYELTTGRVPFRGGSPLQVALQHVSATPPPPSELTDLDPTVEALIFKALAKDPAERPRSAHEFRAELVSRLRGSDMAAAGAAELPNTASPVTRDLEALESNLASAGPSGVASVAQTATVDSHAAPPVTGPSAPSPRRAAGGPAAGRRRRPQRGLSYLTIGVLALLGFVVLAMLASAGRVSVPPLVGLSEDEARRKVETEGLTAGVAARVSNLEIPPGHVISSDPAEGTVVEAGQLVALIVSTGPPPPPAVVPRPPAPPPAADREEDEDVGRKDSEDEAERAEDAAEEAEEAAEDAAEDQGEDDRKKDKDRGRR